MKLRCSSHGPCQAAAAAVEAPGAKLPPGLRLAALPRQATNEALREIRAASASSGLRVLELGVGFASLRALLKLRRHHVTRARKVWKSWTQQRFGAEVRLLTEFPACHKLITTASNLMGVSEPPGELNVILRTYEPGDWLGRHVDDVRMFAEPVLAAILQPGGVRDGLRFTLPRDPVALSAALREAEDAHRASLRLHDLTGCDRSPQRYQVLERPGTAICLEREARFLYGHEVPKVSQPRVSMTWRWLHPRFQQEVDEVREWLGG